MLPTPWSIWQALRRLSSEAPRSNQPKTVLYSTRVHLGVVCFCEVAVEHPQPMALLCGQSRMLRISQQPTLLS